MLKNLVDKYNFKAVGQYNYVLTMKDGGKISLSFSSLSYNTPRGEFPIDTYSEIEIGFLNANHEFYCPHFVKENFTEKGILPYFPVSRLEKLILACINR